MPEHFKLVAKISTDNPEAVKPVLQEFVTKNNGSIRQECGEFHIEAELDGESAKELNRTLLSSLRKVERQTRLRAQWEHGSEVESFFDYVSKWKTNY